MRTLRERVFSSLVTRLTLAVLALLLLSLAVNTAVFVTQSHESDRDTAQHALDKNREIVRAKVFHSLLNANARTPLAGVVSLPTGVDRVLLTVWGNDAVVGDTASHGGPSDSPLVEHISYNGKPQASGEMTIDNVDYAYLAVQASLLYPSATNAPSYQSIIMLARVRPLLAGSVMRRLAIAGTIAILISLVAAVVVLRTMTRPLHAMTRASENMAAGDYDQRVDGDGSDDEIGQLARSFNHMAFEVKRAREMQRQFVANVSHDLRSPLTSIIGFSQVLAEDPAITPQSHRAAEIINSEAERLYRLTMDLLDLSRLEAGRLSLDKRPLDLNAVLRDVAACYHVLPGKRGVCFTERLSPEPLPIIGDPDRLTQVAVNLLDNAIKFCHPTGEVRLTSSCEQGAAVVEVYNTGVGIPEDDLPRVFDRFYRGDHSRAQQTGGSGIGLAIVRELVHAHGGTVTASSALGSWTALTVRLPLSPEARFTKDLHVANTGAIDLPL